jgi:hypothetical protein
MIDNRDRRCSAVFNAAALRWIVSDLSRRRASLIAHTIVIHLVRVYLVLVCYISPAAWRQRVGKAGASLEGVGGMEKSIHRSQFTQQV